MDASPDAAPELRCPRCGAPHDRYQEYCLECGLRLVPLRGASSPSLFRRETWARESPLWLWLPLLAILLVGLVAGAVALAASGDDDRRRPARGAAPGGTTSLEIITDVTTVATLPATTTIAPPTATIQPPTTAVRDTIIAWPAAKRGYTVILRSIPTSSGRAAAEEVADEAIDDGLKEVGVLNSSDYTSLVAGYWVVFTGVHDTLAEARNALPNVRNAGWPLAYVREISP